MRRGEEEQARSRLSEAVAVRARAETKLEWLGKQAESARVSLADAVRRATPPQRARPIAAAELERQAAFIERLRIAERRARERLASFRAHELCLARAAELEAEDAHRQHRGDREGLDKHVAGLRESARRLAERRSQED